MWSTLPYAPLDGTKGGKIRDADQLDSLWNHVIFSSVFAKDGYEFGLASNLLYDVWSDSNKKNNKKFGFGSSQTMDLDPVLTQNLLHGPESVLNK